MGQQLLVWNRESEVVWMNREKCTWGQLPLFPREADTGSTVILHVPSFFHAQALSVQRLIFWIMIRGGKSTISWVDFDTWSLLWQGTVARGPKLPACFMAIWAETFYEWNSVEVHVTIWSDKPFSDVSGQNGKKYIYLTHACPNVMFFMWEQPSWCSVIKVDGGSECSSEGMWVTSAEFQNSTTTK